MKKTLIALAAVAVSGAAFAQATITGNMAVGIQNTTGDSDARFNLTNADVTFAASEDLGGGLKAAAAATLTFEGQRSNATTVESVTMSLSGGFGSLSYASVLSGPAKLSAGVSAEDDMSDAIGKYAAVDVVTYTTPELAPGLTAALEWAGAQGTVTAEAKDAAGAGLGYDVKSWDADGQLALSVDPTVIVNYKAGALSVYGDLPTGDTDDWDLRVAYDLGMAKVGVRMTGDTADTQEFTVTAPMGAMNLGFHYATSPAGTGMGLSASYALSKRTSIGASWVEVSDDTANNTASDGSNYRVQLSHSF
jgi:predicted porin